MRKRVQGQISSEGETLGANFATVRFFSRMNVFVCLQIVVLGKRFRARLALRVGAQMNDQRLFGSVQFVTNTAGEFRGLPRPEMRSHVLDYVAFEGERLRANVAVERFFVYMKAHVFTDADALGENFAALSALEVLFARVNAPVQFQIVMVHERFLTKFAHARLFTGMGPLVRGQIAFDRESLRANVAPVRLFARVRSEV